MNKLVFLEPDKINAIPFTTSKVIADNGKVKHDTVQRLIRNYKSDLEDFGVLGFEIRKPENTKGGRPEKIYRLNEQQATLLITYMQNTLPVRKFKKALVKQFYLMKQDLNKKAVKRLKGKETREVMTKAIKNLPDSPHKTMLYKHYTDLIYKIIFNKNAKQLREQFGITKKDILRDYFTTEQISKVEHLENQVAVLIDFGNDYKTIKAILEKKYLMSA
ncbi:Rha family transcriptional regulator [Clostridium sp.]|uniref:Rha family transcriptional regulator n=1 Tax=Clostridium sp. TaxID=1506 RepID=UPI002FDD954A